MNRFCCTSLLVFWFCVLELSAQRLQFKHYSLEDGLPQSQVTDLVQDDTGYLWLGTFGGGLCRFDGARFELWRQKDGLLSSYVQALWHASDSLFVGTKRGLSIRVDNHFVNHKGAAINAIYSLGNQIYLGTTGGVARYTKNQGVSKVPLHPQIDHSSIHALLFDGRLYWIATAQGLWKFSELDPNAEILQQYDDKAYRALVLDKVKDKIFAAAYGDGIYVIDRQDKDETLLIREPLRVNYLSMPNPEELWVATDNEGLVILDANTYSEKKRWRRKEGPKARNIKKVIRDRHSNIWIATTGDGFYKCFQNNFKHYNPDDDLLGNPCYAVHALQKTIWTSSVAGTLTAIDSLGASELYKIPDFSEARFRTITSDEAGNIWAGSEGRGILFRETKVDREIVIDSSWNDSIMGYRFKIDTIVQKKTRHHIIDSDTGLPSDWIRSLVVDKTGIWAATYSDGIAKFTYDPTQSTLDVLQVFGKNEGIQDLAIVDLKKGPGGKIWYATRQGALGYIAKDRVVHLGKVLEEDWAINLLFFHKNILYLGTAGGGIWWAPLQKVPFFEPLEGQKPLTSPNIHQLIFDDQDQLWLGTELGIDRVVLNGTHAIAAVFHYGKNEGFLGIETSPKAVTKDQIGNLWFGTIKGLTRYEFREELSTPTKPSIDFETIAINYQALDSIRYKDWTNSTKVLHLGPKQTQMTFTYRTVAIDHPSGIQYRFRLDDNPWSPWSSQKKQNLSALLPGNHSFQAQSRNFRWEESDPISFQFYIATPWYKKSWVPWSALGVGTLIFMLLVWWYIGRLKKRNTLAQERLALQNNLLTLEQKALRLQMNPHFIFNVLNGIKAMGSSNIPKMNATINAFALLLRETLYNTRKDQITLGQEIKTLKNYIDVEQLMTPKTFRYEISTDLDLDPDELLIPPMLIQPFVENAIRHGILKGNRDGELQIQFYSRDAFLHGKVIDNGMGIFESQKTKPKTNHQSVALAVTRERLESISGKDALSISEIKDAEGRIRGTEINFKIPIVTDF